MTVTIQFGRLNTSGFRLQKIDRLNTYNIREKGYSVRCGKSYISVWSK